MLEKMKFSLWMLMKGAHLPCPSPRGSLSSSDKAASDQRQVTRNPPVGNILLKEILEK